MNEGLLRLLTMRGWSYREFSRQYAEQCVREGWPARRPSVTTISRWINGSQLPTPESRFILRRLFGVSTDAQLGFSMADQPESTTAGSSGSMPSMTALGTAASDWIREPVNERLLRALRRASSIDASLLVDLEQRTRQLDRADRRNGPQQAFDDLIDHLRRVMVLLEGAPDDATYRRLAVLAGDAAQLAAWFSFHRWDFARADAYSTVVFDAAKTGCRRELRAYGQGQKAYIAFHRGRFQEALDLVEAAVDTTSQGTDGRVAGPGRSRGESAARRCGRLQGSHRAVPRAPFGNKA